MFRNETNRKAEMETQTKIVLDTVLTVAIGNVTKSGETLSKADWEAFRTAVETTLMYHGTVVASTEGIGRRSDDPVNLSGHGFEETAVFIVINPENQSTLRGKLGRLIRTYGQESACFAIDHAHEPAFATDNGLRPSQYPYDCGR